MKKQHQQLKTQSYPLKPVVIIGIRGLTQAVHKEIECALEAHELIKIRLNASDKEQRQTMINAIIQQHQAQLIDQIGHTASFYRKSSKK